MCGSHFWIFLSRTPQKDLDILVECWNTHTISGGSGMRGGNRPIMLYNLPELYNKEHCLCYVGEWLYWGNQTKVGYSMRWNSQRPLYVINGGRWIWHSRGCRGCAKSLYAPSELNTGSVVRRNPTHKNIFVTDLYSISHFSKTIVRKFIFFNNTMNLRFASLFVCWVLKCWTKY